MSAVSNMGQCVCAKGDDNSESTAGGVSSSVGLCVALFTHLVQAM